MKISFITTVDHNVGDDFVREGLKFLLRRHFVNQNITFENIHKHSPITVRYGFERLRNLRWSRICDSLIPKKWTKDRIMDADLLVQSGAPVYWCHPNGPHCFRNEWYHPLIKERFLKNKNCKFLNLAAGTCQRYHSDGTEFCTQCKDYIRELSRLASPTTARDVLAQAVLKSLGIDVPLIPCSSIFAADEHGIINQGSDYIVVNYMHGGAHYTFGQDIDFAKWEHEFASFYKYLKEKKERVIFSCHNQKEVEHAFKIDPNAEVFYKKNDYVAYIDFYSRARLGIMNRVHGAFIMGSFGKPSFIIGNDTRAKMAKEIGLESQFVNDVDCSVLLEKYEYLKDGADNYSMRFKAIKEKAFNDYMEAFASL